MTDIPGLDNWLTSPPEDEDWVEKADQFLERIKNKQPKDEEEAFIWSLIEGLRSIIQDECGM